jgi:ADP-ribose pyrophosphatase
MQVLGNGRFLELVRDEHGWEFARRTNASGVVVIAATTERNEVVLIEQFRPPVGARVIELPAGLVGDDVPDEAMELAAARELEEETGFGGAPLRWVVRGPSSAGMASELYDIFVVKGLVRLSAGGGVEGEAIVTHLIPRDLVDLWLADQVASGVLVDAKVYAGLYWLDRS